MKIGIDLRSLENGAQHRGIGRYATQLIEALSTIDHTNQYVFFVSHPGALPPKFKLHKMFQHSHTHGRGEGLRGVKYVRIVYITPRPLSIDKQGLDVFFHIDTSYPIRATRTPVVSVVYDLIPYIYKDLYQYVAFGGFTPGRLIGYTRMKLRWNVLTKWLQDYKKAARVISISEHSKKDLLKFVPAVQPHNVISIPLAGSVLQTNALPTKQITRLGLKTFLFYVGGADPRKGLVDLVESFEDVWKEHPEVQLVLAGKEVTRTDLPEARRLHKAIAASSRPNQIITLGFIDDKELVWFYEHAAAFVFPSRYEGFGLPILEAMQMGCPVVTYDNSSLPEVAGDAVVMVKDGKPLAPAINKLLGSSTLAKQLVARGKKQAALFDWAKTAKATLAVLEQAAKEKL